MKFNSKPFWKKKENSKVITLSVREEKIRMEKQDLNGILIKKIKNILQL